ncbi:heavy-metal-associated domain-containing protein [Halopelagius fulvigenes]|uniref:Heavy-metal-associated domain-containing protein n=1 Tax=Halopelagius fulvigenes TaxID=1198324 RepID=A0ABD5U6Z7_9EURY
MAENHAQFSIRTVKSEEEVEEIESELENANGVMEADIDAESGAADVRFDLELIGEAQIKGAVQDMGYEVS